MKCSDPTRRRRADDRGFTILEILVTVVVLAIVATVVVLSLRDTVGNAADAAAKADAQVLARAEENYRVLHGSYATEQQLVDAGTLQEASSIHDIVIGADGEYELLRLDQTPTTAATTTTTTTTTPATTTTAATTTTTTTTAATTTTTAATTTTTSTTTTAATTTTVASLSGVTCSFTVGSAWGSGGNGSLTITNNSGRPLSTWTVRVERGTQRLTLWNARLVSFDGTSITATNYDWNGSIKSGATANPTGGTVTVPASRSASRSRAPCCPTR
jgi:prepilin-type N-terminal cleavage/methylation domain-containing protein